MCVSPTRQHFICSPFVIVWRPRIIERDDARLGPIALPFSFHPPCCRVNAIDSIKGRTTFIAGFIVVPHAQPDSIGWTQSGMIRSPRVGCHCPSPTYTEPLRGDGKNSRDLFQNGRSCLACTRWGRLRTDGNVYTGPLPQVVRTHSDEKEWKKKMNYRNELVRPREALVKFKMRKLARRPSLPPFANTIPWYIYIYTSVACEAP